MAKKSVLLVAAIALAFAFVLSHGISKAADTGPETMILKTGDAKKPAKFPHKAHQDKFPCATCHHTKGPDGKQVPYSEGMKIEKCTSCHNDDFPNPKLNSFHKVAHERCKGCHREVGGKAPVRCSGCHVK